MAKEKFETSRDYTYGPDCDGETLTVDVGYFGNVFLRINDGPLLMLNAEEARRLRRHLKLAVSAEVPA